MSHFTISSQQPMSRYGTLPVLSSRPYYQYSNIVQQAVRDDGDIVLELEPSLERVGVSRIYVNCIPVLNRILNGIETSRYMCSTDNGTKPRMRIELQPSGILKVCFTIFEDEPALFKQLIEIVHTIDNTERMRIVERAIESGGILQLLEKVKFYELDILADTMRRHVGQYILALSKTKPDECFGIVTQLIEIFSKNVDNTPDGNIFSHSFKRLEDHPIMNVIVYALRTIDIPADYSVMELAKMPTLLLLHLSVFAGNSVRSLRYTEACITRAALIKNRMRDEYDHVNIWDRVLDTTQWLCSESSSAASIQQRLVEAWSSEFSMNSWSSASRHRQLHRSNSEPTPNVAEEADYMDIEEHQTRTRATSMKIGDSSIQLDGPFATTLITQRRPTNHVLCDTVFQFKSLSAVADSKSSVCYEMVPWCTAAPPIRSNVLTTPCANGTLSVMLECSNPSDSESFVTFRIALAWQSQPTANNASPTIPSLTGEVLIVTHDGVASQTHKLRIVCCKLTPDLRFYWERLSVKHCSISTPILYVPLNIVGQLSTH